LRLLAEAGFRTDEGFPRLILYMASPRTEFKNKFYREIKEQLNGLGIDLDVNYYRSMEQVKESDVPYVIMMQRTLGMPDPADMIRPLFASVSQTYFIGYENEKMESLLRAADGEKGWANRIKIFQRIEKILLEDTPAVPLFTQQNRIAVQPYVRGVAVPRLGMYYLDTKKIWLKK